MRSNSSTELPLALEWIGLIPADKQGKWQAFITVESGEAEEKDLKALNKEALRLMKNGKGVSIEDLSDALHWEKRQVSKRLFRLKEIARSFLLLQWLKDDSRAVIRQRMLAEMLLDNERIDLLHKSKSEIKKNIEALDERIAYQLWPRFELAFIDLQTGTTSHLEEIVPRFSSAMQMLQQAYLYFSYRLTLSASSLKRLSGLNLPIEQWREVNSLIAEGQPESELKFISEAEALFNLIHKDISHKDADAFLDRMEYSPVSDPFLQKELLHNFSQILASAFQKGDHEMGKKELRLRRIMEDRGFHLTRGRMSPLLYRKWSSIAVAVGDLKEARRITKTYASKLDPALADRFVDWNMAVIAFAEGDFEAAHDHLQKISSPGLKFSDLDYAKFSILESKVFFKVGSLQAGFDANKKYRNWINNKNRKLPPASIERYKAWLSVMQRFFGNSMKAKYDKANWSKVKQMIEETNPLDKEWLLNSLPSASSGRE